MRREGWIDECAIDGQNSVARVDTKFPVNSLRFSGIEYWHIQVAIKKGSSPLRSIAHAMSRTERRRRRRHILRRILRRCHHRDPRAV